MFVKSSTGLRLGATGASLSSSFLSFAFAEGFSLSPLSGGASLQGWVEEAWPKQIDMILNLAMVCKLGGPHAALESTLKKLLQLKFAQDVRKGGCPDQARWSIPVPQTQRFHFSCKRLSRLASWQTSTVTFSCNKMHRRFDQPHYPPKQIFVSDKMAEQPELISDNLLEKVLLCDQCVESDANENCLHSRITQEEPDSID